MATRIEIIEALEGVTEDLVRRAATNITGELISNTPVDTGWARANWVPSLGTPFTGNSEPQSRRPRASQVAQAAARQSTGLSEVLAYTLAVDRVFISNNVPYIQLLNDGSSAQAPAMFVQDAIRTGLTRLGGG